MWTRCELLMLALALTLHGRAQTGEIIGGREAAAHSRPYMALVEQRMEDGSVRQCGGFLISDDFVMTAAHCQARSYTVSLGVHNTQRDISQNIIVEQAFPAKDYNATSYRNDIMLLKLSKRAKFSAKVKPIALAEQDGGSVPAACSVTGWGRHEQNSKILSLVLREVNVTLVDDQICKKNHVYCSYGEDGPAEGDSGGPLVCGDGTAYGVVSYKFVPASGGTNMSVYTKIPDYRKWIDVIMKSARRQYID